MVHKAAPKDIERFRTPDRSTRRVIRVGPPANDNRRPGLRSLVVWIWTGLGCLAALAVLYVFV